MDAPRHNPPPSIGSAENLLDILLQIQSKIGEGVVIVRGRQILFANDVLCAMTGYTAEEFYALNWLDQIIAPEEREPVGDRYRRRVSGEPLETHYETTILHKSGRRIEVEVAVSLIDPPIDNPRVAVIIRDITDRKRMEESLYETEQRYRLLVREAAHGIYRSTLAGRFLEVNPALVRMLGYDSEEEVLALDLARDVYFDPTERARLIEKVTKGNAPKQAETRWKRKDGTQLLVRLSGRVVRDPEGGIEAFEVIVEDITERRALEEQVRHAQKMEAVGRLAAGIAHDFNNLLTVIGGYAELLLIAVGAESALRPDIEEILAAARRAAGLTRQLLAFGRKQVRQIQMLDVNTTVANLDHILRRLLGDEIELDVRGSPDPVIVEQDPAQIEQVIINLIANARDAMPEGGRLTITLDRISIDPRDARTAGVPAGRYVRLAIRDTGIGMDEETRARVFEPFFTTKDKTQGTGLGLSTVYGIVAQGGGHIQVESQPGHGTTFYIYLPSVDAGQAVLEPIETGAVAALTGSETILLVEDEESVRNLVRHMLERQGYRVLEASSAEQALALTDAYPNTIHLVVSDVIMPGMNGRALAEQLRRARPGLRVLLMSGYADEAVLSGGSTERLPLIHKPFTTDALARKIRETLD